MEQLLIRLEQKLDKLIDEVNSMKMNQGHLPRDQPLSVAESADYLRLSTSSVYKLIYSGELKPIQRTKGGRILFTTEELNRFLTTTKEQ